MYSKNTDLKSLNKCNSKKGYGIMSYPFLLLYSDIINYS